MTDLRECSPIETKTISPLPWRAKQQPSGRWVIGSEADFGGRGTLKHAKVLWNVAVGVPQHDNTAQANAEFIVRAVNTHQQLIDALKAVMGVIAPVINDVHDVRLADAGDDPRIVWPDLTVLDQVEAALAAAEGKA
jgi:hypothetical protein